VSYTELKATMRHELYFWREERPIDPAADSVLDRLAEDRNLPGVDRLSLATINRVFSHYFPGITVTDYGMESEVGDCSFKVSFGFDDCNQPTIICISSESPLDETPETFHRLFAATRELGCTRIESSLRLLRGL
jgi:hypothetical protein